METIFMNTENSKTSPPHKFVLHLSQRLDLRSSDKLVALQNLSIYYMWENVRQTTGATFQINNAKLYVPVVTLSINENVKFLENIKQGSQEQFPETNIDLT